MSLSEELDLAVGFRRYFRIESAADENSLREVFRLRHEVYCEDLGFEATREEGIETDIGAGMLGEMREIGGRIGHRHRRRFGRSNRHAGPDAAARGAAA